MDTQEALSRDETAAGDVLHIAVQIQRPARPTIWPDTSVLIKIARARAGRRQSKIDRKRAEEIDRIVTTKVREGRLQCIESDQRHEVRESGFELVSDTIESLALGIRLRPAIEARHYQFTAGMKAHLANAPEITLGTSDFFAEDPDDRAGTDRP